MKPLRVERWFGPIGHKWCVEFRVDDQTYVVLFEAWRWKSARSKLIALAAEGVLCREDILWFESKCLMHGVVDVEKAA